MGYIIRCNECSYCKDNVNQGLSKGYFYCEHPDRSYIRKYFDEKRMVKATGFIGFGNRLNNRCDIKTSPAWCPKKMKKGK